MVRKTRNDGEKIMDIIRDAGGSIVGRTKLQKIAYLLELSEEGDGFRFDYHHYGPYSEELTRAASLAKAMGYIDEQDKPTSWGGFYSSYTVKDPVKHVEKNSARNMLAQTANKANSIVLELAATAAYFAKQGYGEPWVETEKRKPDKAGDGRLDEAKTLYKQLYSINQKLPAIP